MPKLKHFAVYIDDMERAKTFYSNLFDWKFNTYGSEDFSQIKLTTEDKSPIGALQARKHTPIPDKIVGFECSFEVDNIDETIQKVTHNYGKIVMPKTEIPGVGWITKFLDTEGNILCAVQYHNAIKE